MLDIVEQTPPSYRVVECCQCKSPDWLPDCYLIGTPYHQWVQSGPGLSVETEYTFPLDEKVKAFLADPSAFVAVTRVATTPYLLIFFLLQLQL
ncbi:60S acidic ribosomal protein P0-like protein [Cricetulus griseus]|nr:60S acidic ribosomal protein P0-like protein [Cricetulus griseus]